MCRVHVPGRSFGVHGANKRTAKAVSVLQLARVYAEAVEHLLGEEVNLRSLVQSGPSPKFQNPALLCLARGIELTFKAYLIVADSSKEPKRTHDLEKLFNQCAAHGLALKSEFLDQLKGLNHIAGLSPYHAAYSPMVCPHPYDIRMLIELRQKVAEQVAIKAKAQWTKADAEYVRWVNNTH